MSGQLGSQPQVGRLGQEDGEQGADQQGAAGPGAAGEAGQQHGKDDAQAAQDGQGIQTGQQGLILLGDGQRGGRAEPFQRHGEVQGGQQHARMQEEQGDDQIEELAAQAAHADQGAAQQDGQQAERGRGTGKAGAQQGQGQGEDQGDPQEGAAAVFLAAGPQGLPAGGEHAAPVDAGDHEEPGQEAEHGQRRGQPPEGGQGPGQADELARHGLGVAFGLHPEDDGGGPEGTQQQEQEEARQRVQTLGATDAPGPEQVDEAGQQGQDQEDQAAGQRGQTGGQEGQRQGDPGVFLFPAHAEKGHGEQAQTGGQPLRAHEMRQLREQQAGEQDQAGGQGGLRAETGGTAQGPGAPQTGQPAQGGARRPDEGRKLRHHAGHQVEGGQHPDEDGQLGITVMQGREPLSTGQRFSDGIHQFHFRRAVQTAGQEGGPELAGQEQEQGQGAHLGQHGKGLLGRPGFQHGHRRGSRRGGSGRGFCLRGGRLACFRQGSCFGCRDLFIHRSGLHGGQTATSAAGRFGHGGSRGGIGSHVLHRGFAAVGLFFGGDGRLGRRYGLGSLGRGRRRFPGFHAQRRFGRLVRGRAFHRRGNGRGGSGRGVLRLHGLCGGHGDGGLLLRGGRRFRGHRRCAGGRALLAVGRGGATRPGPGLFIQLGPGRHAHGDLLFRAGQLAGGIGIFFCHDGSLGDAAAPTR